MKKIGLLCILFLCGIVLTHATTAEEFLTSLEQQGWQLKGHTLSYDGQALVFSAKSAQRPGYDLWQSVRSERSGWQRPQPLQGKINTEDDEWYPSMTSDGREIYYIRRTTNTSQKKPVTVSTLCVAKADENGVWQAGDPLVISNGKDLTPCILPDNSTLIFASRRGGEGKKEPPLTLYYTKRAGKYNWYIPKPLLSATEENEQHYAPYYLPEQKELRYTTDVIQKKDTTHTTRAIRLTAEFKPDAILTVEGQVERLGEKQGEEAQPASAVIMLYDAITFSLLQKTVTPTDGKFRLALPTGRLYRMDITAANCSHIYKEYDCRQLQTDRTENLHASLTRQITIGLNTFDAEVVAPVDATLQLRDADTRQLLSIRPQTVRSGQYVLTLPLGKNYEIDLSAPCYADTVLWLDTRKDVIFSRSELDMEMRHAKAPFTLVAVDKETGEAIEAVVEMENKVRREQCALTAAADHTLLTSVRLGDTYQFRLGAQGYFYADTIVSIPANAGQLRCRVELSPLRKETVLQLPDITFEYNSSDLMESSFEQLDKVVDILQHNPGLSIELSAHTDDHGTDAYNDRLSTRRGESVKRYITSKGIRADRINAVGYGKRRPLVPNDTDEHRAINRRVEFKVLDI